MKGKNRLFDRYLFADFSGGGENHAAQPNIRLYMATVKGEPIRLLRENGFNHSRNSLGDRILAEISKASHRGERIIFGMDHQYAWPHRLREHSKTLHLDWRKAIERLSHGCQDDGLPKLDIPRRYCKQFNNFSKRESFWTPLEGVSKSYGITRTRPSDGEVTRKRLAERVAAISGSSKPKPADAVGGMGEGIVGGQTICGLMLISKLILQDNIAWWPFDGLNIEANDYQGKHVGVEIYPSAMRPKHVQQTDDNDAIHSCLYVREADQTGILSGLLNLSSMSEVIPSSHWSKLKRQIELEGWIVGMDPSKLASLSLPE